MTPFMTFDITAWPSFLIPKTAEGYPALWRTVVERGSIWIDRGGISLWLVDMQLTSQRLMPPLGIVIWTSRDENTGYEAIASTT